MEQRLAARPNGLIRNSWKLYIPPNDDKKAKARPNGLIRNSWKLEDDKVLHIIENSPTEWVNSE